MVDPAKENFGIQTHTHNGWLAGWLTSLMKVIHTYLKLLYNKDRALVQPHCHNHKRTSDLIFIQTLNLLIVQMTLPTTYRPSDKWCTPTALPYFPMTYDPWDVQQGEWS